MAPAPRPWTRRPGGLTVTARLTPRGGRDRVDGVSQDADGRPALALRVSAPPADGAANAALIALVSKALRLPKRAVRIVRGETARLKTLEIDGDPAELEAALERLTA